ncbi:3-dehydroquinate synthase [Nitrolancea hollandica]|uniref:Multifunctional fusion protein n=1 Tax=Nitrolancea hollandica Lb TaxID=1129897 RepID=I4EE25_9BACT|nr:3-dehydroquinate synthase [Nitrolancea hollandica]CCF82937.1 3-dehydroquinate synthase [Nitrolancea hollandica Lb]
MPVERVILIGLSGAGKSSLAPLLAARLGLEAIDTDEQIAAIFDRPVTQIFADYGEAVFRAAERTVLQDACRRSGAVIATGGGAVLDEANWAAMRPGSVIVHLTAARDVILHRLVEQLAPDPLTERPLLAGGDPAERLERLWNERQVLYRRADLTIETTGLTLEQVADEVERAVRARDAAGLVPADSIHTPGGRSDLYSASGLADHIGSLARHRWPEATRAWIISDSNVWPLWGDRMTEILRAADFAVESKVVPAGESSKSLREVENLLDWLIGGRVDRRDIVVALGGGVIGDLAGFVAAIVLRGIGLIQVPTSLLAMVDSSVGGKTGVNHRLGKNLIGSFYQPQLVVADPELLQTLPKRELRAGWAEIIKHGMIERSAAGADRPALLERLESLPDDLASLDPATLGEIVAHNIRLKAAVVREDEREAGLRRLLNYGHTLGHAMEAAGYRYLHGEAIALGLRAAARLGERLGYCKPDLVARQAALLDRAGLPQTFTGELSLVMDRMAWDKKAVHGTLTWVLPVEPGLVEITRDVPVDEAAAVARELGAT